MSLKVYARHGGAAAASVDDITDRVAILDDNTPLVQMGMGVQNGGASQGELVVPDPTANGDASLYFPPRTQVTLTEDASGDELMLAQGRISGFSIGRDDQARGGNLVNWTLTIDDANVDLRGMAFTEDWVRPEETGTERLYALAAYTLDGTSSTRPDFGGAITYRPSTTIVVDDAHLAPDANTTTMPAKTYPADTQPVDVVNDCAGTEGKVFGVVPHHVGGASHLCLLYIKEDDHATYASTIKISDQLADWDPEDLSAPVFEPWWDQGPGQRVDGNNFISGIVSRYGVHDQLKIVLDTTAADATEYWVEAYQDGQSTTATQAAARAEAIIAYRTPFDETDSVSIEMLPEQTGLLTAGMSIQVKAAPINAGTTSTVGTYIDRRVTGLQWEPRPNGMYHAILQLNRPNRVAGGGGLLPRSQGAPGSSPIYADSIFELTVVLSADSLEVNGYVAAGFAAGSTAQFRVDSSSFPPYGTVLHWYLQDGVGTKYLGGDFPITTDHTLSLGINATQAYGQIGSDTATAPLAEWIGTATGIFIANNPGTNTDSHLLRIRNIDSGIGTIDDFERVTGSGWGTSTIGGTWGQTNSPVWSVDGTSGLIRGSGGSEAELAVLDSGLGIGPGVAITGYTGYEFGPVLIATADGSTSDWTFPYPFVAGTLMVYVDNILQNATEDDPATGAFSLSWMPGAGDRISAKARLLP